MNSSKILLVAAILLATSCKKEKHRQACIYDEHNITPLNGNVKQISIRYGSQSKDFFFHVLFDEKGNLTQIQKRSLDIAKIEDKNDTTITTGTTEYSLETSNTNKIAVVGSYSGEIYSSDKTKSKDSSISKWELDKNGRAVSYIWNIYNPASDIGIYKYDAKGNLIEYEQKEFGYAEDRTLCKYKYDNNGQMIESDFYDSGVLLKITTFKYKSFDPNKNWTVQISYSKNHGPWASIDSSLNIDTMT